MEGGSQAGAGERGKFGGDEQGFVRGVRKLPPEGARGSGTRLGWVWMRKRRKSHELLIAGMGFVLAVFDVLPYMPAGAG